MGRAVYVPQAEFRVERHIGSINAASGARAVLEALRDYLDSWPAERVERLQRADAGWAPFDQHQRPLEVHSAADVEDVFRDVHRHCKALRESGIELPPELLELDWVLLFAHQRLRGSSPLRAQVEERPTG